MKFTPSSTARLSTALASSGSSGSPQMPSPVKRIAPKPMRLMVKLSRLNVLTVPLDRSPSDIAYPFRSVAVLLLPARGGEAEDAVVIGGRVTAAVTVARQDPQATVRGLRHVAQTPSLARKERLPVHDSTILVEVEPPEALAAQGRHEEISLPLRDRAVYQDLGPAGRGLTRGPRRDRIRVPGLAALALDLGPTVVLPGLDDVDLIVASLTELGSVEPTTRVPREALHVAVAVGVDGATRERVVRGHPAFRREA